LNSTLRSLVFWIVLILVAGLVWNFSTRFQSQHKTESFSEFMVRVDKNDVDRVTMTGSDLQYVAKNGEQFRTIAPVQYDGLANKLSLRSVKRLCH